ncbi:MAG: hypothetical protein KDE08_14050 [Rhodobacteraceae bacterium]|nr:hypothetical protein [Paracoccaceae bacterium]
MAEEIARIAPSAARRVLGAATLGSLGALLIFVALFRPPPAILPMIALLLVGFLALWLCAAFYRSTALGLVLTADELRDTGGRLVAKVENIRRVERGFLAFRPSNGFSLLLETPEPRVWAPGLWWRIGRRVGVGGVISGADGRGMADLIGMLVARRNGTLPG